MHKSVIQRLKPFMFDSDDCIIYPTVDGNGYGSLQLTIEGKKMHILTHRAVYTIVHNDRLTRDDVIMHSCDTPACCNIRHLSKGTHWTNVEDRQRKGRQAKGEANGRYKHGYHSKFSPVIKPKAKRPRTLEDSVVLQIKKRLGLGERVCDIVKEMNVERSMVNDIIRGRSYKNLVP